MTTKLENGSRGTQANLSTKKQLKTRNSNDTNLNTDVYVHTYINQFYYRYIKFTEQVIQSKFARVGQHTSSPFY